MTLGGKPMDSMCQGMALHVKGGLVPRNRGPEPIRRHERTLPGCFPDGKSMRMTTWRAVGWGWLTSVNPASMKTLRLPTNISPQTAFLPGGRTVGWTSAMWVPFAWTR